MATSEENRLRYIATLLLLWAVSIPYAHADTSLPGSGIQPVKVRWCFPPVFALIAMGSIGFGFLLEPATP